LDIFIRAHEVYDEGYKWFFNNRLLSIYSSNIGPYASVDPYYTLITKGSVVLIRAADF
jgi:diadenosine tetraphosphatase ApaH/serine/threonine PP2A family protein phosphatase